MTVTEPPRSVTCAFSEGGTRVVTEAEFWERAAREGLQWFRLLRRPVSPEQLDRELLGTRLEGEWLRLRSGLRPGDQLWPFAFHVRSYLGLRRGYVALRRGRPVGGVLTEVS